MSRVIDRNDLEPGVCLWWADQAKHIWTMTCEPRSESGNELDMQRAWVGIRCYCSAAQSCPAFCDPVDFSTPGFPVHHQLQEPTQTHVHCIRVPSNHLTLCRPLLLLSIFPSIRVFSNESVLHIRWSKYWTFSISISPSNEYSGLISFRIDWFELFAVQETLKTLLQHHSSKASILWWSAFFIVQLSHPYMTTGKTILLTIWIFIGKVMSLLFNKLSSFIRAFLPRNKLFFF